MLWGEAMKRLAQAVASRRVTFRGDVVVKEFVDGRRAAESFDLLPDAHVGAGARGRAVAVMVDGRDLVELDDGRSVLARVGGECRLLTRWYRMIDWFKGRRYGGDVNSLSRD